MADENSSQLITKCPHCGSKNVDQITRVTGFFSKVSMWNKGKIAELKNREKAMNKRYLG
ncbi:MAG: anaerobic ribonucleoside-triphosphate reductase [Patescibacteria group bacterium]|nr:anaerobic ribonucleoside-triphosphate reductase [Patescibacteria group bacterium]